MDITVRYTSAYERSKGEVLETSTREVRARRVDDMMAALEDILEPHPDIVAKADFYNLKNSAWKDQVECMSAEDFSRLRAYLNARSRIFREAVGRYAELVDQAERSGQRHISFRVEIPKEADEVVFADGEGTQDGSYVSAYVEIDARLD